MKDLDFDELDRAVNSLMKDAPAAETEPKLSDEQTVTINPTLKDGDKPSLDTLSRAVSELNAVPKADSVPVPSSSPEPAPVSALPKPDAVPAPKQTVSVASRRGRIMDVMRPGTTKPETPVRRQSREGVAIDPTRPIVNDVTPAPSVIPQKDEESKNPSAPEAKKTEPSASVNEAKEEIEAETHAKEDWPDPIAMAGYEESELPKKAEDTEKKPDADAPLVSPFLPDAKVEKRPLGGQPASLSSSTPSALEVEAPTDEEGDVASSDAVAPQLPASPEEEQKPLPEELSGDVIALESDANTLTEQPAPVDQEPIIQSMPKEETETPAPMVAPAPAPTTPPVPTGAISIPQQYKEEPSSGDKSTGSIYDTDTYHQPLAHPSSKKSGWLWVVWIVLILVLGAGVGAALYYFRVF